MKLIYLKNKAELPISMMGILIILALTLFFVLLFTGKLDSLMASIASTIN